MSQEFKNHPGHLLMKSDDRSCYKCELTYKPNMFPRNTNDQSAEMCLLPPLNMLTVNQCLTYFWSLNLHYHQRCLISTLNCCCYQIFWMTVYVWITGYNFYLMLKWTDAEIKQHFFLGYTSLWILDEYQPFPSYKLSLLSWFPYSRGRLRPDSCLWVNLGWRACFLNLGWK